MGRPPSICIIFADRMFNSVISGVLSVCLYICACGCVSMCMYTTPTQPKLLYIETICQAAFPAASQIQHQKRVRRATNPISRNHKRSANKISLCYRKTHKQTLGPHDVTLPLHLASEFFFSGMVTTNAASFTAAVQIAEQVITNAV